MTAYWTLLFFTAASLAAFAPTDWHFTFLYPNLMIFGVGMTATVWLPPLYFRFFPPALPRAVEPLIMGMPLVFDRKAARDTSASIQFRVSGGARVWSAPAIPEAPAIAAQRVGAPCCCARTAFKFSRACFRAGSSASAFS